MTRTLRLGVGASMTCLVRYIHPSRHIRERYVNPERGQRLENLVAIREETKLVNRREQQVIVMTHTDFPGIELYAVKRFCKVTAEGPEDQLFDIPAAIGPREEVWEAFPELPEEVQQLQNRPNLTNIGDEDIAVVQALVETDDDNLPAPENAPVPGQRVDDVMGLWGHNGLCARRMMNARDTLPTILFTPGIQPTTLQLFELFFMKDFLQNTILANINERLEGENSLTYGEFLRWLGIWFLMATIQGPQRRDFWSTAKVDIFEGAPFRVNEWMSRNRFEAILGALKYTRSAPPAYQDKFHEVRDMIDAWNANMNEKFTPSWISCLDESMSVWINPYTCPGFMFVPRKPWPFGNEYHTVCCGVSGIMWGVELVEGKDAPPQRHVDFENEGKTVGLLLRMSRPLWGTAKALVLDSGFCVVKGITELSKKGVFAAALIKKRRYWPKYVRGEEIKDHFRDKGVGEADSWSGTLDSCPFQIHCMKEPDYVMSLMTSYGTLNRMGRGTKRNHNGRQVSFQYPEIVHNHFKYRHAVDDHNSKRHQPISLEVVWGTKWWPNRVFAFLLSITEVNVMLASVAFGGAEQLPMLEFRKKFAYALINNDYLREEQEELRRSGRLLVENRHKLAVLEPGKKFKNFEIVDAQSLYPQAKCAHCPRRTRNYCTCSIGVLRCKFCYPIHFTS
eukprot:scaffold11524_cov91-Cylindrotheca_fusiformis.AAC.3